VLIEMIEKLPQTEMPPVVYSAHEREAYRTGCVHTQQAAIEAIRALKGKAAPATVSEAVAPVVEAEWKFRVLDTDGNSLAVCRTHADAKSWIDFNSSFSIVPYTPAPVAVAPVESAGASSVAGEGLTEMLREICDMQQKNAENGVATRIALAELCEKARALLAKAERQPQQYERSEKPAAQVAVQAPVPWNQRTAYTRDSNKMVAMEEEMRDWRARYAAPQGEAAVRDTLIRAGETPEDATRMAAEGWAKAQGVKRKTWKTDGGYRCLNCGQVLTHHEGQMFCPLQGVEAQKGQQ
jgi:rubrerythrin